MLSSFLSTVAATSALSSSVDAITSACLPRGLNRVGEGYGSTYYVPGPLGPGLGGVSENARLSKTG
jgi:hypothetical protein